MIILGLNAKLDGHDPSAVLTVDGTVVAALEEERICGVRHNPGGLPRQAASWVLSSAGLTLDDVDVVALGWDPRLQVDAPEPTDKHELMAMLLPSSAFPVKAPPELVLVRHHLAHAMGAWATCGYRNCAILVVDGSGERESVSVWHARDGNHLTEVATLPFASSPGFFYQALTQHVGMRMFDEGKTMGLAAWGDARWALPSMITAAPVPIASAPDAAHYRDVVQGWQRVFERITGLAPAQRSLRADPLTCRSAFASPHLPQDYRDLAASGQARLVSDMRALAREALSQTGESMLALSGGVALNCSMNGKLEEAISPRPLHVQPACNDSGVALGAACWVGASRGQRVEASAAHVYQGPSFSVGTVADLLSEWNVRVDKVQDPYCAAAALLSQGKTVALFEGGAEFGPRALGGRSILADPSHPGILARVNALKRREAWRPLGPALSQVNADRVFGRPVSGPFMLVAREVSPCHREEMPAAVHEDGTSRAQILEPGLAIGLHRLVKETQARTGTPALVNTSFNVLGPIVLTPRDAMATFAASGLDALLMEGHLVQK